MTLLLGGFSPRFGATAGEQVSNDFALQYGNTFLCILFILMVSHCSKCAYLRFVIFSLIVVLVGPFGCPPWRAL